MQKSQGFTLIELVAVIVILGILAAVAVPRFFNLSNEAKQSALNATVGSIESASTLNYAAYQVSPTSTGAIALKSGSACGTVIPELMAQQETLGKTYTISGTLSVATAGSVDRDCKVLYAGTTYSAHPGILVTGG